MQAFALQPAGQAQRKACLLGQRNLPDVLQQKKIGREILRRAGQTRAAAPVQRFGYLRSTTLPSCQTVRGSSAQRFCPARSVPRIQNLRLLSVPPGNRQCRRTYRENGWFSLHSPFRMYFRQCSSAHGTSLLKRKKPGKTVRSSRAQLVFVIRRCFLKRQPPFPLRRPRGQFPRPFVRRKPPQIPHRPPPEPAESGSRQTPSASAVCRRPPHIEPDTH